MRRHQTLVGCLPGTETLTLAQVSTSGKRPVVRKLVRVDWNGADPHYLKHIAAEHGLLGTPWVWTLPHEQYDTHLVDVPDVPDDEVHDALRLRVRDLISMPIAAAALDSLVLPEQAFRGRNRMAFTFAASREDTDTIEQLFGHAGLRLAGITVADVALRNLAALSAQSTSAAILEMASASAHLNAIHAGELCLNRDLALGYDDLAPARQNESMPTEEFDTEFEFHLEPAENTDGAPSVPPQLDSMALELQRSFDYFDSQLGLGSVTSLKVLSDYPLDDSIYQHLNERFSIQTSQLNLEDCMDFGPTDDLSGYRREAATAIASTLFRNGSAA